MLRRVTWRSWAALAVILGAYVGLGFWFGGNGHVEEDIYKWGLLAASVAPLLFVAFYTVSGNRWFANDLGSALVRLSLCFIPITGPLAWVFWVDHGILTSSLLAWVEVSGPALSTLALLWLGWVFRRGDRARRSRGSDETEKVT